MITAAFPDNAAAAIVLQKRLAGLVRETPPPRKITYIAGADVAYDRGRGISIGAAVILRWPDLSSEEIAVRVEATVFPYVPGLLSFREAPVLLNLLKPLRKKFDVLFVDGQGRAHPRRIGLASHLGLLLGKPTIGCAKSRLCGEEDGVLGKSRGARIPLMEKGDRIGTVLRTRAAVKPIYVSVGHLCRLAWAEEMVLGAAPRYRIPEPTRLADIAVAAAKKDLLR